MVEQTPRFGLDNYEKGDRPWDHSDLVDLVDEHAIERGAAVDRPAEGDYHDELFYATDKRILWRWDADSADWIAVGGWANNIVYPELFGAAGDGVTDDTQAIRDAVATLSSNGPGNLAFRAGREYRITETITCDVQDVRGIEGNNARILVDADVTAFDLQGTHDGTANPDSTTKQIEDAEMHPYVRDLRIHSPYSDSDAADPIGTGIHFSGVFALEIAHCRFYNLGTGIEWSGTNRNITIAGNDIWHCLDYGIHYNGGDLHQYNICNNHISYCRILIYIDAPNISHNLQLVGNSLETSTTPDDVDHAILVEGGETFELAEIVGNNIEGHDNSNGALIKLDGTDASDYIEDVAIVGNKIGRCERVPALELVRVSGATIAGNHWHEILDAPAIFMRNQNRRIDWHVGAHRYTEAPALLEIDGEGEYTSLLNVHGGAWRCQGTLNQPIVWIRNTQLFNCSLQNLQIYDDGDGHDWTVQIDPQSTEYLRQFVLRDVHIRNRVSNGIQVAAPSELSLCWLEKNSVRVTDSASQTAFDLPDPADYNDNELVEQENLSTEI